MRRVRVKICGITRIEDLKAACSLGTDAVGFIVDAPKSPRNLSLEAAKKLITAVPIFVKTVLVTVLKDPERIVSLYESLKPDVIQVHGGNLEMIRILKRILPEARLIGTVPIKSEAEIQTIVKLTQFFDAILVDSYVADKFGGTGVTHDWRITACIRDALYPKPLILAGGLKPENVKEAIRIVRPYAVDVSSGVEVKPGLKDPEKIKTFIEAVNSISIQD